MSVLLQSDSLNVTSERQVYETLVTWCKSQYQPNKATARQKYIKLFAFIRFMLLPKVCGSCVGCENLGTRPRSSRHEGC